MNDFSFLANSEIESIDNLYADYKLNPSSVDLSWQQFFKGFEFANLSFNDNNLSATSSDEISKEFEVKNLIQSYRQRGHFFTKTNPVRERRKYFPTLDIENFNLTEKDLDTEFFAGRELGLGRASLRTIISHLKDTYCRSIGVEYLFVRHPRMVKWLQEKMEANKNSTFFSVEDKKHNYDHLNEAIGFEQYIHKRFVGQKRFSLEGAETVIPALDALIEYGAEMGVKEFVFGMAHRGRLNVLANVLKKPNSYIFKEFVGGEYEEGISLGDVKYHLGYGNVVKTDKGHDVTLNLAPNPSHLETVGPIVQGISRAKIDNKYKGDENLLVPVIIHGDAAIAGQGVVYETIQMSTLRGYRTGGTIHLVINNQIGFTTNYLDARSSTYCTDVAKVTRSPIFHVNGDDVEAFIHTMQLALEYRQEFHTDVFIDVLSYRKYGHNEGDEPRFTQPNLYKAIAKHKNPREIYAAQLIEEGVYTKEEIKEINKKYNDNLDADYDRSLKIEKLAIYPFLNKTYKNYRFSTPEDFLKSVETSVSKERLISLADKITNLPEDLNFFKKIHKLNLDRKKMISTNRLDWAMGEFLAYASLLEEGFPVRVSGQDSERGTFSHRHASLITEDTHEKYYPLKNISDTQAKFHIYNSPLNEYAVLAYEYGFALAQPKGLTIWEAQFGDFHNVAQPVIDQYISAAEDKWGIKNGLVMFLPHGYEGQGAEHSSARMERFLDLCANNNMQIVNPTSPASLFHLLRRQVRRDIRLPLICFTPKSLLRNQMCTSSLDDMTSPRFIEVIDDNNVDVENVRKVIFCTGKIYYELLVEKNKRDARDIALVRLEQIYPFPQNQIDIILTKYSNADTVNWVQEEPENMGAWKFVNYHIENVKLEPILRKASGSPASGLFKMHVKMQESILNSAFK